MSSQVGSVMSWKLTCLKGAHALVTICRHFVSCLQSASSQVSLAPPSGISIHRTLLIQGPLIMQQIQDILAGLVTKPWAQNLWAWYPWLLSYDTTADLFCSGCQQKFTPMMILEQELHRDLSVLWYIQFPNSHKLFFSSSVGVSAIPLIISPLAILHAAPVDPNSLISMQWVFMSEHFLYFTKIGIKAKTKKIHVSYPMSPRCFMPPVPMVSSMTVFSDHRIKYF